MEEGLASLPSVRYFLIASTTLFITITFFTPFWNRLVAAEGPGVASPPLGLSPVPSGHFSSQQYTYSPHFVMSGLCFLAPSDFLGTLQCAAASEGFAKQPGYGLWQHHTSFCSASPRFFGSFWLSPGCRARWCGVHMGVVVVVAVWRGACELGDGGCSGMRSNELQCVL